ncbi:MAG: hypothetical protein WCS65_10770 [Verrucomicrobiae bacterium]
MTKNANVPHFAKRLLPAVVDGGFAMEGYWIWCGSVVRGEDADFQMARTWNMVIPLKTTSSL